MGQIKKEFNDGGVSTKFHGSFSDLEPSKKLPTPIDRLSVLL